MCPHPVHQSVPSRPLTFERFARRTPHDGHTADVTRLRRARSVGSFIIDRRPAGLRPSFWLIVDISRHSENDEDPYETRGEDSQYAAASPWLPQRRAVKVPTPPEETTRGVDGRGRSSAPRRAASTPSRGFAYGRPNCTRSHTGCCRCSDTSGRFQESARGGSWRYPSRVLWSSSVP